MKQAVQRRLNPLLYLPLFLALAALSGCGGGGGGGGGEQTVVAPTSLVYDDAAPVYRTDGNVVPNTATTTGGAPTSFIVNPPLPAGLALNPITGEISGVPTVKTDPAAYTVTAANGAGSVDAIIDIEVKWVDFKSIEPLATVTDADIRYFMERAQFGFTQAPYDDINTNGLSTYLDTSLAAIAAGQTDALEAGADAYVEDAQFPDLTELALWWLHCIQETSNPLQESLALHWHDHFACSSDVLQDTSAHWYADHINLWRHGAAGNLRTLVLAMARDWSMLEYLDGRDSTASQPNENFGREFLELFLLGVNNGYDQDDIVAAAALFSGYRRIFLDPVHVIRWTPTQHNSDDQNFLGVDFVGVDDPPQDIYDSVIDVTLAHKPVGDTIGYASRWIVRSLLRRYCYENPAQELVDQLAALLEAGGWELAPVIKTMFLSEAFNSALSKAGFVKTPTEHLLGFTHTTGLRIPLERNGTYATFGLDLALAVMGNRPSQPPVVAGWPEDEAWFSAQGMVDRANTLNEVVRQRQYQIDNSIDPATLLPSPTATAQETVTALALRFQITLTQTENDQLVDFLNTDDNGSTTVDPWDATDPIHIDSRFRGLLYILAQHPQYLLR